MPIHFPHLGKLWLSRRAFRILAAGIALTLCPPLPGAVHVGQKIEVEWHGTWYPAEVLAVNGEQCRIHYAGYGSNWDEWVGPERVRETLPKTPAAQGGDAAPQPSAQSDAWQMGDEVEAWNVAWYPASILEVGAGTHAGYYRVHFVNFSSASDQWIKAADIRSRGSPAGGNKTLPDAAAAPRLGRYRVTSTSVPGSTLVLGELELLDGGHYRVRLPGGRVRGEGTYVFDGATASVTWLSGPYHEDGFGGGWEITREGRTQQLRLSRGTVATNSTD